MTKLNSAAELRLRLDDDDDDGHVSLSLTHTRVQMGKNDMIYGVFFLIWLGVAWAWAWPWRVCINQSLALTV